MVPETAHHYMQTHDAYQRSIVNSFSFNNPSNSGLKNFSASASGSAPHWASSTAILTLQTFVKLAMRWASSRQAREPSGVYFPMERSLNGVTMVMLSMETCAGNCDRHLRSTSAVCVAAAEFTVFVFRNTRCLRVGLRWRPWNSCS